MKLMLVAVLSSLSVVIAAEREIICSSGPVEAVCDQDVTLQCHLEPPLDATDMTVKWSQVHNNNTVHHYQNGRDNPAEQKEHYEGRTSLYPEGLTKGNLSLKLSSVKPNDAGRYRCSFQSDELQKSCYVNLTVGESAVIGSSEPVTVVVGDNVILPCHLEPSFDVKTLTVEWKSNDSIVHVYRNRKDKLIDQEKKFKNRTSLFHDEMSRGNISLKLTNVTEQDAGNYSCYVPKLHSQVREGYVTLVVAVTNKSTFLEGYYYIIIIVAVVILAVVICAVRRNRK